MFVRYFATLETGRLRAGDVTSFEAGLAACLHTARCRRGGQASFQRALDDAAAYLQVRPQGRVSHSAHCGRGSR